MRKVHLLVLIHGMWGSPNHLSEMCRVIKEVKGAQETLSSSREHELDVLVAQTNGGDYTYDGIDWGAERVVDEVIERIKNIEISGGQVTKFSVCGYSLGGLVARYLIGILRARGIFERVQPINFTTFATPHIGLIRTGSLFSYVKAKLGPKLLSRTGKQFFAVDKWGTSGRSLLEVMADRKEIFYQTLLLFKNINIYGNAVNDITVSYPSSLIDTSDPFVDRDMNGLTVEFDSKYNPVIINYFVPDVPPPPPRRPIPLSPTWFKSVKNVIFMPPVLQLLRPPFNMIAILFLPVLLPVFLTLVLARLSLSSWSSRGRVRLLESDEKSKESKLVHIFARLERNIEEAVEDLIEQSPGFETELDHPAHILSNEQSIDKIDNLTSPASQPTDGVAESTIHPVNTAITIPTTSMAKPSSNQPILTPVQIEMVHVLNMVPNLRKHFVFIDPIRNSHATIIARDVKMFDFHKRGWGVLRHWADAFEL